MRIHIVRILRIIKQGLRRKNVVPLICGGATIIVGMLVFRLRFALALSRGFDMDEFAYFMWANHILMGYRPYIDFFYFITPLYLVFLSPLFLLGKGIDPLIASRVLSYAVFCLMAGVLAFSFWKLRKSWLALVPPLLLAMTPMPADKFLESRPDNLAALLSLIGMVAITQSLSAGGAGWAFCAGVFYMLSFLTLQKSAIFIIPLMLVLAFAFIQKSYRSRILACFVGALVPFGIFCAWAASTGDPTKVFYSVFTVPSELMGYMRQFSFAPDLFFYPNTFYYSAGGYSPGLLFTYAIWIIGFSIAIYRLCTPFLTSGESNARIETLFSLTFFANVLFFIYGTPFKHTQYLIPVALFLVWYVADGIYLIWNKVKNTLFYEISFSLCFLVVLFISYYAFLSVSVPKLTNTNAALLQEILTLYATIPPGSYVLDLEGRTIYYPYPLRLLPIIR